MRFGFSRAIAFLSSVIGMGRGHSGAAQAARTRIKAEGGPTHAEPVKHRYKTGGPNWLKIAINSQKRR